ncbi:MAG TPA: glycosyltransferase family 4 protein, partial [Geminicoccaceae bacterium]|nr:glycosyltransferase family 4 protein [Geminicoccaceae bacterium]
MSLAFYAPLKSPDHPTPSGDRRMARALIEALRRSGRRVEIACRLRSYDRAGDAVRQRRLQTLGERCVGRLLRRYRNQRDRPQAWLTYHGYHKAPDWLGPEISAALRIPYLLVEASFAPKQCGGPWALGHEATERAIGRADVVIGLTGLDLECLAPLVAPPAQLHRLPPFLDPAPYAAAQVARARHRAEIAARWRTDSKQPWLLTVAMMRADVKRDSYLLLAQALGRIRDRPWQLLVVGDGPSRGEIEAAFAPLGPRATFAGALPESQLPGFYAACDLYVWPAVREAYGLAMLEAQAAGLPVVAGHEGGVSEVVQHEVTGVLTPPRDPQAFAEA